MRQARIDHAAMCQGRQGYDTYAEAKTAIGRFKLNIYHCPHCGQFHLGNKPKGQGRPKPPPPAIELEF